MIIKPLIKNARKPDGFWGKLMIKKMNNEHAPMTLLAIESLNIKDNDVILDIGCGGGNAIKIMAEKNPYGKVCGVDYSELSVQSSQKRNKKAVSSGRVEVKQGTVSMLPYSKETFDIVTAIETIYFWEDPQKAFDEVKRVLKQGGRFCIVIEMIKNEDGTGDREDIADFLQLNYYSESEIKDLLTQAGLKNITINNIEQKGWLIATATK